MWNLRNKCTKKRRQKKTRLLSIVNYLVVTGGKVHEGMRETGEGLSILVLGPPRWPRGLVPPSALGMIRETRDRVPCRAPCMEPAPPLPVSLPLSLSLCMSHKENLKNKQTHTSQHRECRNKHENPVVS